MRSSALIEDLIASQQYDIGLAETPEPRASINQKVLDLECLCLLHEDDPLASHQVITPELLDGKPLAVLFEEHATAKQTEAAFHSVGCRYYKYLELRTFLPSLQFVAEGLCYVISDMITTYSYLLRTPKTSPIVLRHFTPQISNSVSLLTQGYVTPSLVSKAFADELSDAIEQMKTEIDETLA